MLWRLLHRNGNIQVAKLKSDFLSSLFLYLGISFRRTRDVDEADIFIQFCHFSDCYPDKNVTEKIDLTATTLKREQPGGGRWNVLVNTDMSLSNQIILAKLSHVRTLHLHVQLEQVGCKYF